MGWASGKWVGCWGSLGGRLSKKAPAIFREAGRAGDLEAGWDLEVGPLSLLTPNRATKAIPTRTTPPQPERTAQASHTAQATQVPLDELVLKVSMEGAGGSAKSGGVAFKVKGLQIEGAAWEPTGLAPTDAPHVSLSGSVTSMQMYGCRKIV